MESVVAGLSAGLLNALVIVAFGAVFRAVAIWRAGGIAPAWLSEFAWLVGLACWTLVVAIQFFLTGLVTDPVMFIVAVLVGGLAAWWVASRCARDAARDTPA